MVRKFYKLYGLYGVFDETTESDIQYYLTGTEDFTPGFLQEYAGKIDEHTILFITACGDDEGKYIRVTSRHETGGEIVENHWDHEIKEGDTMIWARGDIYSVSTKAVTSVEFDNNTRELIIQYSDGSSTSTSEGVLGYTAQYPVTLSPSNEIGVEGYYYTGSTGSAQYNFIENPDCGNQVLDGVSYAHVEGIGNIATNNYQHIQGRYADVDDYSTFIIGNGTQQNPHNAFTVSESGVAHADSDFTTGSPSNPETFYKLTDIHSVLDSDWAHIE